MESELASLIDLALAQGASYTTLVGKITDAVELAFRKQYKESGPISVVIDQQNDVIRILSGKKDITPKDFDDQAGKIARRIILQSIQEKPHQTSVIAPPPTPPVPTQPKDHHWAGIFANIIFWGYNGLYTLYVVLFVISLASRSVRESLANFFTNSNVYTALLLGLLLSYPLLTIYFAVKTKLYQNGSWLLRYFFMVEIPLVTITFFALFTLADPIPAVGLGMILILLIPVMIYLNLLKEQSPALQKIRIVLTSLSLATAGYVSLLVSFFIPLIIGGFITSIRFSWFNNLDSVFDIVGMLFGLTFAGIGIIIGCAIIMSPFVATYFLCKMLCSKTFTQVPSFKKLVLTTLILFFFVFIGLSLQPNTNNQLSRLSSFSKATTFEAKETIAKELTGREKEIEAALKDMQGAGRRYPFREEDRFLEQAYRSVFDTDNLGVFMQDVFNVTAAPFTYRGPTDYSGKLSTAFFDVFRRYPNDTYYKDWTNPPNRRANPPVNTSNVEVFRTIRAKTDKTGLAATITVEEQYQNKTYQNQEVIYEFSFPTAVAITDLKLGPNLEFSGIVAPRGASKTVYEREVNRSRDPALLEQTGPRQYRLRVFPIPGLSDKTLGGKPQRVQFTYVTTAVKDGYPLPVYSRTQNVKLPVSTTVFRNDTAVGYNQKLSFIPFDQTVDLCSGFKPVALDFSISTASAQLAHTTGSFCGKTNIPTSAKIAILFDVSYEAKNNRQTTELSTLFTSNPNLFLQNSFDLYRFNTTVSKPRPIKSVKDTAVTYFGRSDLMKTLSTIKDTYDAVIVISSNPEAVSAIKQLAPRNHPVYMVGTKTPMSQELTEYILASDGTTTESIEEALNLFANQQITGTALSPHLTGSTSLPIAKIVTDDPFSILTAVSLFKQELVQQRNSLSDLTLLDKLHEFAGLNRFVTPYSSMLALVNETQMKLLEEESKRYDRYSQGSTPMPVFIPGVPMPMLERSIQSPMNSMNIPMFNGTSMLKSAPGSIGTSMMMDGGGSIASPMGAITSIGSIGFIQPLILINILLVGVGACAFLVIYLKKKFKK